MLPTFLVIGAKKGGTSSLHRYLGTHPDVFVPEHKRVDFFSGVHWDRGEDWYRRQFRAGAGAAARGEVCNSYTHDPVVAGVPERARQVVPDARLVYLVRHPIERIESHYRQAVGEWGLTAGIDDAVWANPGEFVAPSRYGHQVARWLEHYPADQLRVVTAEDLRTDPAGVLAGVFGFLGVDPTWVPPNVGHRYNQGGEHRLQVPLARRLRTAGAYRTVRRFVPGRFRRAAWIATSRPPSVDPAAARLSPAHRDALLDELRPDLERLAALVPDAPSWGLLDPASPR